MQIFLGINLLFPNKMFELISFLCDLVPWWLRCYEIRSFPQTGHWNDWPKEWLKNQGHSTLFEKET